MTRWKPMSIERYADALYDREQILDRCEIRCEDARNGGRILGDVSRAWSLLANHSRLHCLPFRPESFDLTNRDHGWESRIVSEPLVRARFRRAYAQMLARGGIRLYSTNGVALDESTKLDELVRDEARMRNPLLFVKARIPGLVAPKRHPRLDQTLRNASDSSDRRLTGQIRDDFRTPKLR